MKCCVLSWKNNNNKKIKMLSPTFLLGALRVKGESNVCEKCI